MSDSNSAAPKQSLLIGYVGTLLVRLFVPAWIFFGALTKVRGATPKSLPRSILDAGGIFGIQDHFLLLAILTIIEFCFIGIMLFAPRLARHAAISILSIFLVVLSVEMFGYGNYESCGCFGEKSIAPTTMFAIDFALLLGVIVFKPHKSTAAKNKSRLIVIPSLATIFILLSCYYTFSTIMSKKHSSKGVTSTSLPSSWYPKRIGDWLGKSVDDIELFSWVIDWPNDIREGKQYVIFYSLSCDHCEALLWAHFEFPSIPTTLVAIPQSVDGFNYDGGFDNPCHDCGTTELQVGTDWIIGSPLVIAIEQGIVKCATENEDYEAPACLIW
jgi:hypothetical protein